MWAVADYRRWSPGEESAAEAIQMFGNRSTLIDFGCGECKALEKFRAAGMDATGVDIVALRPDVVETCLWNLPASLPIAEYGFCADVMEHIPPAYVDAVLRNIADKVNCAAYFRISTIPDSMGALIGETLHLTVQPANWWSDRVQAAFGRADIVRVTSDHCIIVGQRA